MAEVEGVGQVDEETGEVIEPEEPTEDEDPFEEPEPEQEQEATRSVEAAQARDKALEREHKSHETRLANIHGSEEWENYSMCPLCIGDGYLTPWANGEMPDEQYAAITALAGHMPQVEYKQSTKSQMCEECDGRGHTISGAQPPNDPLKLCDVCGGNGYVPKAPSLPQPAQIVNGSSNTDYPVIASNWGSPAANDEWGRAAGHPHYGVHPSVAGLTG